MLRGLSKIIEDEARIHGEFAHLLSAAVHLFGFDDANGEAPEAGDIQACSGSVSPSHPLISARRYGGGYFRAET